MKTFRVAHTGDLHYSNTTLPEVDRCMEAFVAATTQPGAVDAVVIGGDSTDHRLDAHTPAFLALSRRVKQIASHVPLLMLQGTFSHEPPGMLSVFELMGDRIFVADRICQVALTGDQRWVASQSYCFEANEMRALFEATFVQAVFTCLPSINKGVLVANTGNSSATAMGDAVATVLGGFAEINEWLRGEGIPTLGVSHGTVHNSMTEHGVPMHGTDHEYTSGTLFSAGCSAFLLNHIHLHQQWEVNARRIAYSGSLPRLHYGEIGDKGWLLWTVSATAADFEIHKSPAQEFAEFVFRGVPDLDLLRAANVVGKKVRVEYCVDVEHRQSVNDQTIRDALIGALEVKLEPHILPVTRSVRAQGLSEATSDEAKLQIWCTVTGTDNDRLPDRLRALAVGDPATLAAALFASVSSGLTESPAAVPVRETAVTSVDLFTLA